MKLPTIKKILREDVKEAPNWVNGLIDPLNTFMETTYQALNKNLTFDENISSFTQELIYKTPSTYPTGVDNVSFQNTLRVRPIGVQVLQCYERSTYIPAPGPVYVPWVLQNDQIVVYPVTGLAADKTYTLKLVVF